MKTRGDRRSNPVTCEVAGAVPPRAPPDAADGGPDMERLEAFLIPGDKGINYNTATWHHPLTVLDSDAQFAALVWEDGSEADTEWYTLKPEQQTRVEE